MARNWWVAVLCVVAGVTSGCGAIGDAFGVLSADDASEPDSLLAAVEAYDTCVSEADPTTTPSEILMWLDSDVELTEIETVQATLESLASVENYRYKDADESYNDFHEFYAEAPEILDLVGEPQIPTSFEVDVTSMESASAVVAELEVVPGVESIIGPKPRGAICPSQMAAVMQACAVPFDEALVWLDDSSGDSPGASAVAAALDESAIVKSYTYIGFDETAADFDEYFADREDILELGIDSFPTSFKIRLVDGVDQEQLESLTEQIEAIASVSDVVPFTPGSYRCPAS